MGRRSSLSSSKGEFDICCRFEEVQVVEQAYPLPKSYASLRPKILDEGSELQVDDKCFFIAGKYKVAWKRITFLEWQTHDDTEDATLLFSDVPTDEQNQPTGPGKRIQARIGVEYHSGRAPANAAAFRRAVEKKWNKMVRRQQRQQERAQEEGRETLRSVARSSSKRRSKASLFLSRNARNEKGWESSDDDDNVFNRKSHKELLDVQKQRRQRQQEEDDDKDDRECQEPSNKDEEEHKADLDDDEHSADNKDTAMDDADTDAQPLQQRRPADGKGQRLKRKQIQDVNTIDSDDELFGEESSTPDLTTPMAHRVVTPGSNFRKSVLDEEEDGDEEENGDEEAQKIEDTDKTASAKSKGSTTSKTSSRPTKTISSFFAAQLEAAEKSKDKRQSAETTKLSSDGDKTNETTTAAPIKHKKSVKHDFFAPRRPARSTAPAATVNSNVNTVETKKTDEDHDEDSDAVDARPAELGSDGMNDDLNTPDGQKIRVQAPPRTTKTATPGTRDPQRTLASAEKLQQDDDPFEDLEDHENETSYKAYSALNSPLAEQMSGQKRRFNPRKAFYGSKPPPRFTTASRALEMADKESPDHRNLYAGMDGVSTSHQKKQRITGSPLSAIRTARPLVSSPVSSPLTNTSPKESSTPPQKWRGLRNMGNTCYMNASLQMLYSIPAFVNSLTPFSKKHRLVDMFCQTYKNVLFPSGTVPGAARTSSLKDAIDKKTDRFRGYQQRDAHEFLGELIDQVHEDIEGKSTANDHVNEYGRNGEGPATVTREGDKLSVLPTDDYFRLNVEVCLKCKSCGYSRTKEEMYRYLSVDINTIDKLADEQISPKVSVEKCLANFFRPEDREIKCEKCEEGTEATQTLRILSQPKALLIHLKRFVLVERPSSGGEDDKENNLEVTFQKNRAAVELTEELSLEDFMKDEKMKSRPTKPRYALKSIVHHIGSTANSGHYTADALRPGRPHVGEDQEAGAQTCEPQWVSYDDGLTTETTLAALRGNISNQRTAYILLYSIE